VNAEFVVCAPGRVNLIGEHTDYQHGFVLPMAIGLTTTLRVRTRDDGVVRLRSAALTGEVVIRPGDDPARTEPAWGRYPAAVVELLRRAGVPVPGLDGEIAGDLPLGGGLSSSAALDVAVALAVTEVARRRRLALPPAVQDRATLAAICRDAEALGAGVRCGIMDPFVSLHGQTGAALLLDCRSLDWRAVRIPADRIAFVVADTGVRHSLASGEYGERRRECEDAARILGVDVLRDATPSDVARARDRLGDVLHRRARHVVHENGRVLAAVPALESGDADAFGLLLDDSHASLRDDFSVSCPELDALVAAARAAPGALGARMTGGGFGGCVVVAARPDSVGNVLAAVRGHAVTASVAAPSRGARLEGVR
jgi:galactokinase